MNFGFITTKYTKHANPMRFPFVSFVFFVVNP